MGRVNPVQPVTNPDGRDWIRFEEAVGPPFERVVMVHRCEREEIRPGEGILNFLEQQKAVMGLRKDPLAEEVSPQPLPTWQSLPVAVLGADFEQARLHMMGEGSDQFSFSGPRWAVQ